MINAMRMEAPCCPACLSSFINGPSGPSGWMNMAERHVVCVRYGSKTSLEDKGRICENFPYLGILRQERERKRLRANLKKNDRYEEKIAIEKSRLPLVKRSRTIDEKATLRSALE